MKYNPDAEIIDRPSKINFPNKNVTFYAKIGYNSINNQTEGLL